MLEAIIGILLAGALLALVVALVSNISGRDKTPEIKEVPYVPDVSEEQLEKWLK